MYCGKDLNPASQGKKEYRFFMSEIWKWINSRIPLAKVLQLGLDEDIPGGSSFFFTLGSATLFVFILQMITGIWQLFYYVPTIDHAYDSINFLRLFVPYGCFIEFVI